MFDFTSEKTRKSFEKSLHLLELDYVDVIQVEYFTLRFNTKIHIKIDIKVLIFLTVDSRYRICPLARHNTHADFAGTVEASG